VVFDAGSSRLDAGGRMIVPALRRLGVRHLDAVVISHPNLDHYSAVPELVESFAVKEVYVTSRMLEESQSDLHGPAAFLIQWLRQRGVIVHTAEAGQQARFGAVHWRWLHPPPGFRPAGTNDSSMVITLEAAGRRVLFCGDLARDGIDALRQANPDLCADVVELPHHGSYSSAAERFVRSLRPQIVVQSTGRTRWRRDHWADALRGVQRLVTARDGACSVEIDRRGRITTGTFIPQQREEEASPAD
jgi:competence protein ComEC